MKGRAWAEMNLANLRHNVKELQKILPHKCEFMAVVKANGYGHGSVEMAIELNKIGITHFAVATLAEGIELRINGVKGEILILGYTSLQEAYELQRYQLTQTIVSFDYAKQLNKLGQKIMTHLKIDTGMNRLGERCENITKIKQIFSCENLEIKGIYTHLSVSDQLHVDMRKFTYLQIEKFHKIVKELKYREGISPKIHMQSSYGILNFPELHCDFARIGIAMYGVLSAANDKTKLSVDLRPVLSLKARISIIKEIKRGEFVGYGRQYRATRQSKIAGVSIGYADGFPRSLASRNSYVLVSGQRAPIIGKICMDQLLIDITNIRDVKQDDIVTLIGTDGTEQITAEQVAENAGTITNELLSRLGERIERIWEKEQVPLSLK